MKNEETINEDKIIETEQKEIDYKSKYMYLLADFDNYKKNTTNKITNFNKFKNKDILIEILNLKDNFERAINQEEVSEGIKLIYNQLLNILTKNNVEEVPYEFFNDKYHEAIGTTQNPKEEHYKITGVQQQGYLYNNEILRFAKVLVNINK